MALEGFRVGEMTFMSYLVSFLSYCILLTENCKVFLPRAFGVQMGVNFITIFSVRKHETLSYHSALFAWRWVLSFEHNTHLNTILGCNWQMDWMSTTVSCLAKPCCISHTYHQLLLLSLSFYLPDLFLCSYPRTSKVHHPLTPWDCWMQLTPEHHLGVWKLTTIFIFDSAIECFDRKPH